MKQMIRVLLLTVLSAFTVQAAILVDFGASSNWITANANGQGLTTNSWKHVPFSMSLARSPTNGASGYAGPVYYGGATGTVSMTSWTIANATPDYINAGGTSTGIGSKVTALIMFTNQSATITQVVYGLRVSGTSTAQTNFARIVIRKTDGSFYISEAKSSQSMAYFTNANPSALTWYDYNPNTAFSMIGNQVFGLTLNNVNAVGEFLENRVTATNQTSVNAGIQVFQANGTASVVATPTNVTAYLISIRDVATNGTMNTPTILTPSRTGQQANKLSASVAAFELPDLQGASIISATLKFQITSQVSAMTAISNCNLNLEAIRSGPINSAITTNDFRVIGLRTGEAAIQNDIVVWTNSMPRQYEATGIATSTLGNWLSQQYTNVGVAGTVFLRLAPDKIPSTFVSNSYYYNVPITNIQLVITTDGNTVPSSGFGNTVLARIGATRFSWTFDQAVSWGHFIDGMPWVVMPASGNLSLVSATPSRLNNQTVSYFITNNYSGITNADINITVKNPPFTHTFNTNTLRYANSTNGVYGWDSRAGKATYSGTYNASLGWDGSSYLALSAGDSITTPASTVESPVSDRAALLDSLAVLTVLTNIPPDDAFRPAVIRSGTDRTSPEILRYSQLINLNPYLITNPVGTSDLRGTNVSSISAEYTFTQMRAYFPGPWFVNIGYSTTEGHSARYNNYAYVPDSSGGQYGATLGQYMGYLAVGSLANWLSDDERKLCRIRYIQRAIDVYSAVKAGVCLEEGAGILPGYSTLLTVAGVMMNHNGMKTANQGINGTKPWWIFADYATTWHTDGISTNDLAAGEVLSDRLIALHNTSTNRANLNKTNVQSIAAATLTTMTMKTNFWWDYSRPIANIINLKFRVVSGTGAGSTIYVITNTITDTNLVVDVEKFRTSPSNNATLFSGSGNLVGFCYGGKFGIKPAFQNGIPNSSSVLAFSTTTDDVGNLKSDNAEWYWSAEGVVPGTISASYLERKWFISTSPLAEYAETHSGGTIGNLIALYALGQQNLYKGGIDKYLINIGERAGYGERLFSGEYAGILGSGSTGHFGGALWKQKVLNAVGSTFLYTSGTNSGGALDVPNATAKMWYE